MAQSQGQEFSVPMRGETSGVKRSGSRRSWSSVEERALLVAFKDIIACGWKTPNGYRTGYIQQLEVRMKQALPGTGLRGNPHILSKYGSWKKTYQEVYRALGKTGMGWNSTLKTIRALPEDWDDMIMRNPDLAHLREKPFPYYEDWVEIYGRDGATGNGAFDFNSVPIDDGAGHGVEVVEETNNESPNACLSDNPTQAQSSSPKSCTGKQTSKGKRKRDDEVSEIVCRIDKMWGRATEVLNKVANAIERDVDTKVEVKAAENRKNLYDAIKDLPLELTRMDRVRVTSEMAKRQDQLDVFFELPIEEKCDLVVFALQKAEW